MQANLASILPFSPVMRVLVTGGSGVVGASTITALLRRGHAVRLLSRNAGRDAEGWSHGVEPWEADVADLDGVAGAADGCGAIIHVAGIAKESPPDDTFERINLGGTRNMVSEAERSGVRRFVFVSSLGAPRGQSAYHQSKAAAEAIVREFAREWVIVRPGAVYGPGDEHLSVLLRVIRSMPVVLLIGGGDRQFQPVWHEDLAEALARSVDLPNIALKEIDVTGVELTTQRTLTEQLRALCGRSVLALPIPTVVAEWGLKALGFAGIDGPIGVDQLQMLRDGNFIPPGAVNGLVDIFGVSPTPLAVGLRRFVDEQPESLPAAGTGSLRRKRFQADIRSSALSAAELQAYVRSHLRSLIPGVDPAAGTETHASVSEGDTLTLRLPVRGSVQVRVAEVSDAAITLLTIEGHPLAGAVRFLTTVIDGGVRFEVVEYDRAANVADLVAMRTVGDPLQSAVWNQLVRTVASVATVPGEGKPDVGQEVEILEGRDAQLVDQWAEELSLALKRRTRHGQAQRDLGGEVPATP